MKTSPRTSHASILAVITLSLALCACDSGDKKDTGAVPPLPPKKSKPDASADAGAAAKPEPPEPGDAPKNMNEPPPPAPAFDPGTGTGKFAQLDILNAAAQAFKSKQAGQAGIMATGKSIEQLRKMGKPSSGVPLTSLDQLVKAGLLKSIPEAPAGKKYVIDPKMQEVRLENK